MKQFEVFINFDTGKEDYLIIEAEDIYSVYAQVYEEIGYDPGEVVVNEIKVKPVVYYTGTAEFSIWPYSKNSDESDIIVGHLEQVINHPKLGVCNNVRTSTVIVPVDNSGQFETKNTIYKPYQNVSSINDQS
jgi:hypothetical protein